MKRLTTKLTLSSLSLPLSYRLNTYVMGHILTSKVGPLTERVTLSSYPTSTANSPKAVIMLDRCHRRWNTICQHCANVLVTVPMQNHQKTLKRHNQAKIVRISVFLFWFLDVYIICQHVSRPELRIFFNFVLRVYHLSEK